MSDPNGAQRRECWVGQVCLDFRDADALADTVAISKRECVATIVTFVVDGQSLELRIQFVLSFGH